jgi:hypothetical protein
LEADVVQVQKAADPGGAVFDDGCPDCGEYDCLCVDHDDSDCGDDPEHCDECALYGEFQCRKHSDAYIAACREEHEFYSTQEALETLAAFPDAGHGLAWDALQWAVRDVLAARGAR